MFSLVYISRTQENFSEADLLELLESARERNQRVGITGMLLYKDGNFMQLLEGDETAVRDLYAKIANDERHCNLIVLMEETICKRQFESWSMGFQNLRKVDLKDVPGYSEFLNLSITPEEFSTNLSRPRDLLCLFRNIG